MQLLITNQRNERIGRMLKKDESNQREHNIKSTLNPCQFNVQTLDQRFSTLVQRRSPSRSINSNYNEKI